MELQTPFHVFSRTRKEGMLVTDYDLDPDVDFTLMLTTQKAAGINPATAAEAAAAADKEEEAEEEDSDDDGQEDYQSMTVAALRSLLKAKGLSSTGKKAELVRRLQEEGDGSDDESDGDENGDNGE